MLKLYKFALFFILHPLIFPYRIPDYFLEERKRRKILEDLGVSYRKKIRLPEDVEEEEEQKVFLISNHFTKEKEKAEKTDLK